MQRKYRILCVGSGLLVAGCGVWGIPEEAKEITAVLADSRFNDVGDVTHQGNLEGLEGCWGTYQVLEGFTYAAFFRIDDAGFRWVNYSNYPLPIVVIHESATYEKDLDGRSVIVDFPGMKGWDAIMRRWDDVTFPEAETYIFELALDGDRMEIEQAIVERTEETTTGPTCVRFEECP